jgi:metallophosphoesterase superfamily enzyme
MTHYNKRSNIESTFSAIKRKLGDTLKSRNTTSQINELLCKIVAYKILKPKLLIINGDIKNEFSSTKTHEFNELFDFFKNIKKIILK